MATITVTIVESTEQILSGIPRYVTITTDVIATIFYTLDGTTPTLLSSIYIGNLYLPTSLPVFTLKVLATDGSIYSEIVSTTYQTNILQNARLPHSATDAPAGTNLPNLYPFGTNPLQPTTQFLNPGDASITVDNPSLTQIPNAFDADGNPTTFTNYPYTMENYSILYPTTNANRESGPNIGSLPEVLIDPKQDIPEETEEFTNTFNPKAFVIYQDTTKQDSDEPAIINSEFFSLEDPENIRDGVSFYNCGLDAPPVMGSFVRVHYNPTDNTDTYYYHDTHANRWIISKTPHIMPGSFDGNLANVPVNRRSNSVGVVIEWIPGARRYLF